MKNFRLGGMVSAAIGAFLVGAAVPAQTINFEESATPYADVRGWSVYSMGDGRGVYACRAVRGSGYNDQIMIEYDGFDESWRLMVQGSRPEATGFGVKGAAAIYDGFVVDRQIYFGAPGSDGATQTHAKMDIGDDELRRFTAGNRLTMSINGERDRSFALTGTTAATLKVEECARSFGFAPRQAAVTNAAPRVVQQPAAPAPVDGFTLGYVRFPGGQLRATGGGAWVEEGDNGGRFFFQVYDQTPDGVFLNDPSRNLQLWVSLYDGIISYTQNFDVNTWTQLYLIDCYDTAQGRAC